MRRTLTVLFVGATLGVFAATTAAETVTVCFWSGPTLLLTQRPVPEGTAPLDAALHELMAGPTAEEAAAGITSAIPAGTTVQQTTVSGDAIAIDFSKGLLSAGVDEVIVESIFRQVSLDRSVTLTVDGRPLASYLPPKPKIEPRPIKLMAPEPGVNALAGHSVTVSPGHGWYWNGSGWYTQRPVYCSPLNEEDFHNLEMCQYLETYLAADGATVRMARCTNKSFGSDTTDTATHIHSGKPWWQCAGYLWIQQLGYPCGVYASYTGDCVTGSGGSESSDDVRARPLMSDQDGTDIYVSVHTNGYTGDCTGSCPTGTETYYDNSTEHAPWGAISQTLANNINSSIMSAITANVDGTWTCHGTCVKDSAGNYGEIRIPDRAATLTELAFHDTCDRDADANHLRDNFFRSAAMWGIYKGICQYFGTSPTWDFYSDEYVSDTIPTTMTQGETYNVSVTFRNRGVLWKTARGYRLGAVGDSDPLTTVTRVDISGEVGPGVEYTFNFQMRPLTAGDFTTDWRMVRDGYTWFGATLTKNVHVEPNPDVEPPTTPTNLAGNAINPTTIQLTWTASTDNFALAGYEIRRDGVVIGTSTTNSYTDSTCSPGGSYVYDVRAYDNVPNYSDWSDPVNVSTPATDTVPPTTPTNLTATCTVATSVKLTWTASTDNVGVTGYDVRRNGEIIASPTGTSYTDNTVSASTTYVYEVRARDAALNYSDWSAPASVNTPAARVTVFADGFDGNLNNWTAGAAAFVYDGTVNHGNVPGAGSAKCPVGASSQMYHVFSRPFAECRVSGWYRDPTGGKNGTTCSYTGARQALSLREPGGSTAFILDNGLSQNGGASYTWRLVGDGGSATHTAYAPRNTAASCSPTWVYFETVVTPNAPGASPIATFTVTVNDGGAGMPMSTTQNIGGAFFTSTTNGVGRITLGLGVSTTGADVFWDDIVFEAAPPNPPIIGTPTVSSTSQIVWNFSRFDNNVYGFEVADADGTVKSPQYPNSGWLNHNATSWTEGSLAANTQYTRKVRAWNGTLTSDYSATVSRYTRIEDPTGVTFANVTVDSVEATAAGTLSNLTAGSSGVLITNTTNGGESSGWQQTTSWTETGLAANTQYTFQVKARNGDGLESSAVTGSVYTLSVPPDAGSIASDKAAACIGEDVTWTAVSGFGPDAVAKYRYAWDQNPSHTFTGSEAEWTSGTIVTVPSAAGTWYLHVQGLNGDGVPNGTFDYSVTAKAATVITAQPQPQNVCAGATV
ncbi:MAG: N-acetylmuramoyl-L-alanine amidase, partial [Phycisphaerae bacterium]